MVTRDNHPGTCKLTEPLSGCLVWLWQADDSTSARDRPWWKRGAERRAPGVRLHTGVLGKNIIKTRQQMPPAPWERPYAAQKSQQGGVAVNATQNKALSSPISPSIRSLCAGGARGRQSRKQALFFAENYLTCHLKDEKSAKSLEQLGRNTSRKLQRAAGRQVRMSSLFNPAITSHLNPHCKHFPNLSSFANE